MYPNNIFWQNNGIQKRFNYFCVLKVETSKKHYDKDNISRRLYS